jgi:hypothetical protein
MPTPDLYKRHRLPVEIISHCVWLYYRFSLSYRDVEELMVERGVTVSYEAVRYSCRNFGQAYANQLRWRRPRPGDTWHLEMCQTQPRKMSWRPLRLIEQTLRNPRGGFKRENEMDVNLFSRDDDFAAQALNDGLPFFKRQLIKIISKQLAKGCRMVDHLLPVDTLLPPVSSWLTFLLDLRASASNRLRPYLELA